MVFRPAVLFAFALVTLAFSAGVCAKTSINSLQQAELPCPANSGDNAAMGAAAVSPVTPAPAVSDVAAPKTSSKAARQRWKMLLPGALKSAS